MKNIFLLLCCLFSIFFTKAQAIVLATYQYADNNRIANITPLAKHLQAKLGREVKVVSYPTVHLFIEAIQKNEVDIALINTFGYLLLEASPTKYPMQPMLALQVPAAAQDNYKTAIVAPINSPINSLNEIKQHAPSARLMLVNVGSTSGNLVPRLSLANVGLPEAERNFKTVSYGKNHKATIDSIASGYAEIGAVGSSEYFSFISKPENLQKIKLVWLSTEIPLGPVLVNNAMDATVKDSLRQAMLQINTDNAAALLSVKNGWSEARQAEQYISITPAYYSAFKQQLGTTEDLQRILRQFAGAL